MVVVDEVRMELIGLAPEKAVKALEAATERPLVLRTSHGHLPGRSQVPLADGEGGIAVAKKDLRQKPAVFRHGGVIAGEAGGDLDDATHAVGVMVPAREEGGPRRGAESGGVEVRVPEPVGGQPVEGGRGDVRSVTPELGIADIVEQDDHHIGGPLGGGRKRWPPRSGRLQSATDHSSKGDLSGHGVLPWRGGGCRKRPRGP